MAERRLSSGRRTEDVPKGGTWQEAAVHNHGLIIAVQRDYKRFVQRVTVALIILTIMIGIILWQLFRLVNDNSQRVTDIQNGRISLCRDQNQRHDATISRLNREIPKLPPRERARAESSKAFTIALIDTLAPKRACNKVFKLKGVS